jgi:hypothetical protein
MRLGSRNRRQGDRRNRQMFLKRLGSTRGSSLSFSEKDQAINPHRKRESQRHVNGCETSRSLAARRSARIVGTRCLGRSRGVGLVLPLRPPQRVLLR